MTTPSRADTMAGTDRPQPVPLPEQEWLPMGMTVDQVVICRDGSPARIVAPDPRWFALQKLWMSDQAKRTSLKRAKDRKQGKLLLDAVAAAMPHYPLDEASNDSCSAISRLLSSLEPAATRCQGIQRLPTR